jgi:hypothetical protein
VPATRWWAATRKLAPVGATAIRLCRYGGLNDHPRLKLLNAALVINRRTVGHVIQEFDSLKQGPAGSVACPSDDGSQILALVAYPRAHRVTISVGLTGCSRVVNGDVSRTAANFAGKNPAGPELVGLLKRLVHGH